jgi:hypothetical protein
VMRAAGVPSPFIVKIARGGGGGGGGGDPSGAPAFEGVSTRSLQNTIFPFVARGDELEAVPVAFSAPTSETTTRAPAIHTPFAITRSACFRPRIVVNRGYSGSGTVRRPTTVNCGFRRPEKRCTW